MARCVSGASVSFAFPIVMERVVVPMDVAATVVSVLMVLFARTTFVQQLVARS